MYSNTILTLTLVGIICLYKIYLNSDTRVTANLILENVYLHILVGLTLTGITALAIDKSPTISKNIDSMRGLFGSFVLSMIGLFVVFTAGNSKAMQYAGFATFMLAIGIMTHPYVTLLKYNGKGAKIFLSVVTIVAVLSLIAFKLPEMFLSWGSYLVIILLALIIVEAVDLIVGTREGLLSRTKIYGWIGVILFSCFILYDSQRLVQEAKIGEMISTQMGIDDINYPALSLSIYLDIVNLFGSLVNGSN